MQDTNRVLLFDLSMDDSRPWVEERARATFRDASMVILREVNHGSAVQQLSQFAKDQSASFTYVVLPFRFRYLTSILYWRLLLAVFWARLGAVRFIQAGGYTLDPLWFAEVVLAPLVQPLLALVSILARPQYIVKQVYRNFLVAREDPEDEFVGFGKNKGVGGLIYWLTIVKKVRRFGLFGLAHDTYMGMPLSLHTWPLAAYLLGHFGYRRYVYFSALLLAAGMAWLCWSTGHTALLLLVPLILLSNIYLFNIYVGTWELLSWGLGFVAFAAVYAGQPLVAGAFTAAALLAHPGVASLIGLCLVVFATISPDSLSTLAWMAAGGALLSTWWLVPYRMASAKLGRNRMINSVWQYTYSWTVKTLYQLWSYSLFLLAAAYSESRNGLELLLVIPLVALLFNTKIRWVYSEYTVFNYMLFIGGCYLVTNPDMLAVMAYLLLLYQSSRMLWDRSESSLGFDLTPVRMGAVRTEITKAFSGLRSGRIGFEMGRTRGHPGWDMSAAVGYVLADENLRLLNTGYTEVGDYEVYERYGRYFNSEASQAEFESACRESGVCYMVVFTNEFRRIVDARGYKTLARIENARLSPVPSAPAVMITIHELPWKGWIIEPPVPIQVSPNHIRFEAQAGHDYRVKLTALLGWRAFQDRRRLRITDGHPGLCIHAEQDGLVTIKYALSHYWFDVLRRRQSPVRV